MKRLGESQFEDESDPAHDRIALSPEMTEAESPFINLRDAGRFLDVLASLATLYPVRPGILEFYNGVDEIFDVQVLPNILRAEIVSPRQWAETPSIATMKGGFWQTRPREEDEVIALQS